MTEIASVAKYMLVTQIVKREQNLCLCYDNRVKLLKTDHNCFLLYRRLLIFFDNLTFSYFNAKCFQEFRAIHQDLIKDQ